MAQFVRRLYGRYGTPLEKNLEKRFEEIGQGTFDKEFERVMGLGEKELREIYTEQQRSREVY
jgi:hypothetical protein